MSDFSTLEKSVIKTLSWFDIFDRPLTLFELRKFLYQTEAKLKISELHKAITALGKSANISDFMNGDEVSINPNHPDSKKALSTIKKLMK